MRIDGINIKHKRLIDEYVRNGGNGAKAWRTVYAAECRNYTNANTPNQSFYLYVRKPRIKAYLQRKLQRMMKRAEITEDHILTKYEKAFTLAEGQAKASEMIAAASAQAKLVGLLKDRQEVGPPGSFEHMENVSDVLAKLAESIGEDAALQIGKALGVLPGLPAETVPPEVAAVPDQNETIEQTIALLESDSPSDSLN